MLIVIPTYRRNATLKWVLESLIQCYTEKITEEIRILIVNNYSPAKDEIAKILEKYRKEKKFSWHILFREKTLDPVDNWYSAIGEYALPNEVVLLHGDDDLFYQWSLEDRYQAIRSQDADMLISRSAHKIIFLPNSKSANADAKLFTYKNIDAKKGMISFSDIEKWGPAFIGNHCYQYTEMFQKSLSLAFEWCHKQDWLDWNTRTLMLPYYLPFAIKYLGGDIASIDKICVVRGTGSKEISDSPFGVPGWNSGFLALCAYIMLNSSPLGEIEELASARRSQLKMAVNWLPTLFFDPRVSPRMRKETISRARIPWSMELFFQTAHGLRLVAEEKLIIRKIRNQLREKFQGQALDGIIYSLRANKRQKQ